MFKISLWRRFINNEEKKLVDHISSASTSTISTTSYIDDDGHKEKILFLLYKIISKNEMWTEKNWMPKKFSRTFKNLWMHFNSFVIRQDWWNWNFIESDFNEIPCCYIKTVSSDPSIQTFHLFSCINRACCVYVYNVNV